MVGAEGRGKSDVGEKGGGKLQEMVEDIVSAHSGRHPGIVTEAIVSAVTRRYEVMPHQGPWMEKRRNHPERIRRFSHEVFRVIESSEEAEAAEKITSHILSSFHLCAQAGED